VKLFHVPGYASLAPHIALREAGARFTLERVDLATGMTDAGRRLRDVHPSGHLGAIEIAPGDVVSETPVCMLWIAHQYPAAKLAPAAGTREYFTLAALLNEIATEIHMAYIWLHNPTFPAAAKATLQARLDETVDRYDAVLRGRDTLLTSGYSVADCFFYVTMTWALPDDPKPATRAGVQAFMQRMQARPAVQAARAAEGL
jgi:glutathione S-transferase